MTHFVNIEFLGRHLILLFEYNVSNMDVTFFNFCAFSALLGLFKLPWQRTLRVEWKTNKVLKKNNIHWLSSHFASPVKWQHQLRYYSQGR